MVYKIELSKAEIDALSEAATNSALAWTRFPHALRNLMSASAKLSAARYGKLTAPSDPELEADAAWIGSDQERRAKAVLRSQRRREFEAQAELPLAGDQP